MIGNFLDEIFERARGNSAFAGFDLVRMNSNAAVKYPIKKPYVAFGTENSRTDTVILGEENCGIFSEEMVVSVVCDEKDGGSFCEMLARDICIEIMKMDSGKNITSVSVGKCSYDKDIFGYRIMIRFGLCEKKVLFGGD